METEILKYAEQKLGHDRTGHGVDHAQRVASLAEKIRQVTGGKKRIIWAAALLHDVIDDKVTSEPKQALADLTIFLQGQGFACNEVQQILSIIQNISFAGTFQAEKRSLSLEGQIVQDADRLDALGALGIMRAAYFGGAHGEILYDPTIKPKKPRSKAEYREPTTVINHFYEKLFLLPDLMNTAAGQKEAHRRLKFMEDFLQEFYSEWDFSKPFSKP